PLERVKEQHPPVGIGLAGQIMQLHRTLGAGVEGVEPQVGPLLGAVLIDRNLRVAVGVVDAVGRGGAGVGRRGQAAALRDARIDPVGAAAGDVRPPGGAVGALGLGVGGVGVVGVAARAAGRV